MKGTEQWGNNIRRRTSRIPSLLTQDLTSCPVPPSFPPYLPPNIPNIGNAVFVPVPVPVLSIDTSRPPPSLPHFGTAGFAPFSQNVAQSPCNFLPQSIYNSATTEKREPPEPQPSCPTPRPDSRRSNSADDESNNRKQKRKEEKKKERRMNATARNLGDLVVQFDSTLVKESRARLDKKKRKSEASTSTEQPNNPAAESSALLKVVENAEEPAPPQPAIIPGPSKEGRGSQAQKSWDDDLPRLTEADMQEDFSSDTEVAENMEVPMSDARYSVNHLEMFYEKSGDERVATSSCRGIMDRFSSCIRALNEKRSAQPTVERPKTPPFHGNCKCGHDSSPSESESSSSDDDDVVVEESVENGDLSQFSEKHRNVQRKRTHPAGLHPDLCFSEPLLGNDGPVCRCSIKSRNEGIRHNRFAGEGFIEHCDPLSNNCCRLRHYVLKVTPAVDDGNMRRTTIINCGEHYTLEGFSILFHRELPSVFPPMPMAKWTTEYQFALTEEPNPECYTVRELELFYEFLFVNVLELYDVNRTPSGVSGGCPIYHVMPRFVTNRGVRKILPMQAVLSHFTEQLSRPVFPMEDCSATQNEQQIALAARCDKSRLIINPSKKPTTIRVDGVVRQGGKVLLTHLTTRPPVYNLAHNHDLPKLQKRLSRLRSTAGSNKKCTDENKQIIADLQTKVDRLRSEVNAHRHVTCHIAPEGFYHTGLFPDIVSHVLLAIQACQHVRYHWSLSELEYHIGHSFKNRSLLELALTHPSFKLNYGTNADHSKNILTNCGYRKKASLDDRRDRKRGINNLMTIMSQTGMKKVATSPVLHNERLEYLGDAVVEMIVSNRLFFLLPHHGEGGLATYRSALVQNRNLASLAKNLRLDEWLLFAHGTELCHEADFRHALANAFEAIMAALYLDSRLEVPDRIFSVAMFGNDPESRHKWENINEHRLIVEYPEGDRHLIEKISTLQKLTEFEEMIGLPFKHIRLLAKAFTRRNVPFNDLTKGNNQRLEWLGDTVLQLIVSDYLYKHFPYHHEGHLSLLRTCLVSNKTQAVICDDLGMANFVVRVPNQKIPTLRVKDKADLVESLIGAMFVDRGWKVCKVFVKTCFLPRLKYFITDNRWNDPKSQLQQCCLTLRCGNGPPDIPEYRTVSVQGPTNSRVYRVVVYFRGKRIGEGEGGNVHQAQMNAAMHALHENIDLFPSMSTQSNRPAKKRRRTTAFGGSTLPPTAHPAAQRPRLSVPPSTSYSNVPSPSTSWRTPLRRSPAIRNVPNVPSAFVPSLMSLDIPAMPVSITSPMFSVPPPPVTSLAPSAFLPIPPHLSSIPLMLPPDASHSFPLPPEGHFFTPPPPQRRPPF